MFLFAARDSPLATGMIVGTGGRAPESAKAPSSLVGLPDIYGADLYALRYERGLGTTLSQSNRNVQTSTVKVCVTAAAGTPFASRQLAP